MDFELKVIELGKCLMRIKPHLIRASMQVTTANLLLGSATSVAPVDKCLFSGTAICRETPFRQAASIVVEIGMEKMLFECESRKTGGWLTKPMSCHARANIACINNIGHGCVILLSH